VEYEQKARSNAQIISLLNRTIYRKSCFDKMKTILKVLSDRDIDRIIEMAWEDRTPFEAIELQFGLAEQDVIKLMRRELKPSSWRLWRERAHQISHKHLKKRSSEIDRFKCTLQRQISFNKISKR
jgi:uncharacterized protein (TIGR03643 family)